MKKLLLMSCALSIASCSYAQIFDITSVDFGANTAAGTSNGIAFTFTGSQWDARTVTDGSYVGFNTINHLPPIANTDVLHIGNLDPTFVFAETIDSALIYLADNTDGFYNNFFDFGVSAEVVSGNVEVVGTSFRVTSSEGGVVRLTGINSTTITSINTGDGNDFAIVVTAVPEPTTLTLLGVAGIAGLRKRRKS